MKQPKITVVGLGPGRFGLITLESWQTMQAAEHLVLRTRIHPTVAEIEKRGLTFSSYDGFYEEVPDFETLYRHIAEDLLRRATEQGDLVYAVPGSPLVAERTVVLLRELAKEVMYTRLCIDPIEGLTILDAEDVSTLKERPAQSLVITQVYDPIIASDTKLMLMEFYPDEYEVTYIHNLALPDESIRKIPLYELDRQKDVDHLTSLFVPAQ